MAHTAYQQHGGEDVSHASERELLRNLGHDVCEYRASNADFARENHAAIAAARTVYNRAEAARVSALLSETAADVFYVNNTFPALSPAIVRAAARLRIPTIVVLRNYRMVCAAGSFRRDGQQCFDCAGRQIPWPAVHHSCYRSRGASAAVASMQALHALTGTYTAPSVQLVALSYRQRHLLEAGGLPVGCVEVKPNFVAPEPELGDGAGGYVLFAGRLSTEKGFRLLADAWRMALTGRGWRLVVAGSGPEAPLASALASGLQDVDFLGARTNFEVLRLMAAAAITVVPSVWEEPFGRTAIESLAVGTPIVVTPMGALPELLACEPRPGVVAESLTPLALGAAIMSSLAIARDCRAAARQRYQREYSARAQVEHMTRLLAKVTRP